MPAHRPNTHPCKGVQMLDTRRAQPPSKEPVLPGQAQLSAMLRERFQAAEAKRLALLGPLVGKLPRRAGGALAQQLRDKGWSIRDAADYLGVSRQRLYTVFEDPQRARLWECAVAGIPPCTPEIVQQLRAARRERLQQVQRAAMAAACTGDAALVQYAEYEVGDVVRALTDAGIADEDEDGTIAELRHSGGTLQILVRTVRGQDWFPQADFDRFWASTGLNIHRGARR